MPFEKGHKKSGGRKKGSINKRSILLTEKAEELGVDPFEILLLFAKGDWKALGYEEEFDKVVTQNGINYERVISAELRAKSASNACEYLYPKRKTIDFGKDTLSAIEEFYDMSHADEDHQDSSTEED